MCDTKIEPSFFEFLTNTSHCLLSRWIVRSLSRSKQFEVSVLNPSWKIAFDWPAVNSFLFLFLFFTLWAGEKKSEGTTANTKQRDKRLRVMEKQIEQQAKSLPLEQLCSALKSQVPMEQLDVSGEKLKANQLFPLNQDKKWRKTPNRQKYWSGRSKSTERGTEDKHNTQIAEYVWGFV